MHARIGSAVYLWAVFCRDYTNDLYHFINNGCRIRPEEYQAFDACFNPGRDSGARGGFADF